MEEKKTEKAVKKPAAEKTAEPKAEKKEVERQFIKASDGTEAKPAPKKSASEAEPEKKKSAVLPRVLAIVFWLVAIAFEALTILVLNGTLYLGENISATTGIIIGIVADLIFVVAGSLLWKKANHIAPASEKNKFLFALYNNLGVIASVIAFLPLIILLLRNKDMDAKTKRIVSVIACVALLAAAAFSIDYNPVSKEDMEAEVGAGTTVYWTRWGKSYHLDPDCQALQNSEVIYSGTIDEAFEARRTDPCDFCAGGADSTAEGDVTEQDQAA